jgi:hypothetical protein
LVENAERIGRENNILKLKRLDKIASAHLLRFTMNNSNNFKPISGPVKKVPWINLRISSGVHQKIHKTKSTFCTLSISACKASQRKEYGRRIELE